MQRRKLADTIEAKAIPYINKLFNSATNIPTGLQKLEVEYKRKLYWPRSIYVYKRMWEMCQAYIDIPDRPYLSSTLDVLSVYKHPWTPSYRHTFDLDLDRNKRALDKAAGLPKLGRTKREELPYARQYVEDIIKPARSLTEMSSVFPGFRTQQSNPDEPKVRLIWMYPITTWVLDCEALDSGITQVIEKNQSSELEVKLFYCTPQSVHAWFKNWSSKVVTWVNGDASQYDASVRASELSSCCHYFAPNYEFIDLVSNYVTYSSLVMPEGDLHRTGGMPSGWKGTNLGDGWTNFLDWLEALKILGLDKYLVCVLVNGDDITLGFSTVITTENLESISHLIRRKLNVEKTKIEQFVWNSKWYIDNQILTRPIYRCLNSIMFSEHRMNPLSGSKEYVEIAMAMQLRDIEQHPLGPDVIKCIAGLTKYHISNMDDQQLAAAAKLYLDEHSWMVESGMFGNPDEFVKWVRSTEYAQALD